MSVYMEPTGPPPGCESTGLMRGYLGVFEGDRRIGIIVETGGDWLNGLEPALPRYRVLDAGAGVPLPDGEYDSERAAQRALVAARDAANDVLAVRPDGLSGLDVAMLEFELTAAASAADGGRERTIQHRLRMNPTEYGRRLAALLADPQRRAAATRAFPAAVSRLDERAADNRARRAYGRRGRATATIAA